LVTIVVKLPSGSQVEPLSADSARWTSTVEMPDSPSEPAFQSTLIFARLVRPSGASTVPPVGGVVSTRTIVLYVATFPTRSVPAVGRDGVRRCAAGDRDRRRAVVA
jgi:hypothetical protein